MLKINRLQLHNFMCVSDADLIFNDSKIILLIGNNGAGKSTVLTAIALCLLESKRSDSFKENVKLGETESHVELDAEINGKPINISIDLSSTSSTMNRYAKYDGKEYKNSEVSVLLDSFDLRYYSDIIMSAQGAGDITKLTPAQREVYLQKLLNFDFTEQNEECKEHIKDVNDKISYNTNQIEFSKKMIAQRTTEIKNPEPLNFSIEDENSCKADKIVLTQKINELSEKIIKKNTLLKSKTDITSNSIVKSKQAIARLTSAIEYSQSNVSKIDSLNNDKVLLEKEIAELNNNYTSENTKYNGYDVDIKSLSAQRDDVLNSISIVTSDKSHAQKHLNLIASGKCPECGKEFTDADKEKYDKELSDCESSLSEYNSKLKIINDKLIEINTAKKESQNAVSKISNDISGKKSTLRQIDSNIQSLQKELESIEANKKALSDETERLSSFEKQVADIDNELSTIDDVSEEYTKIHNDIDAINTKLADYTNQRTRYDMAIRNNETIKNGINELNNNIISAEKLVDDYRAQFTMYDEAQKIFDKTLPAYLILKTCTMLESSMNDFIHIIFPKMGVYLFQSKKGVEFFYTTDISALPPNFEKTNLINVKMASGFEKAVISIAFKVCLCRAYGLSFAFMDEIDEAGTDENSESLFRSVLSNDLFNQLFIISHKPMVRDVIQNLATSNTTYYVKDGSFSTEEQ